LSETVLERPAGDPALRRRAELREFLMSRRARITPERAGFPSGGGRRRTPGLRREEVAVLAGVGASWYQWLEQGRDITVSPQVLDSVGRVLELDDAERRHLYALAGLNPPAPAGDDAPQPVPSALLRLIDSWLPSPAHIMDRHWNVVASNVAVRLVLGFEQGPFNCLTSFFTSADQRSRYADWEAIAPRVVAQFRAEMTARPEDPEYGRIADHIAARSPEFAELWARREVRPGGVTVKTLIHPAVGGLHFEATMLQVPEHPELRLVMQTPCVCTDTKAKMAVLVAEANRRHGLVTAA